MDTEKQVDDLIKIANSNLENAPMGILEEYFWEFYPHEISWAETPFQCKEALRKIGRFLVQNAKLKPAYLPK